MSFPIFPYQALNLLKMRTTLLTPQHLSGCLAHGRVPQMFAEGSFPSELLKQQALKSLPGDLLLLLTIFPG